MKNILLILNLILYSYQASAIDLTEALTIAYVNNDEFKKARKNFLKEIEVFPQAIADFLPDINGSVGVNNYKNKNVGASANKNKNYTQSIIIDQNLFSGGKGVAGLKAAQASFRSSKSAYYHQEQQTLLTAITAYIDCYNLEQKFKITEISLKNNRRQLEAVQERFKLGDSTTIDVASAQAALSAAETNKLTAYANMQGAKANFLKIFSVEPENLEFPVLPENLPNNFEELMLKTTRSNPNFLRAKHSLDAQKAKELSSKAALLPSVDLRVQAGKNIYEAQNSAINNNNNISVSTGISVSIPIYSKGGKEFSKIRSSKSDTQLSIIDLDNVVKENKSACRSSWEGFNAAKSSIISSREAVEAAQVAYDGTTQEEIVGSKTILDVLNAEERLNNTRNSKADVDKQYILAAYQIKSLIGQLTAKSLKLNVDYFIPEKEFKKAKMKIIGF